MKKTTREFIDCKECRGTGNITANTDCFYCKGTGLKLFKETIEESDDMKEFIEKKCGWELVEGKERVLRYGKPFLSKTDNCSCWKKIAHIAGLECYWGEMWKEKQDQF